MEWEFTKKKEKQKKKKKEQWGESSPWEIKVMGREFAMRIEKGSDGARVRHDK